jgi:DNA-binding transcriptional ArsR family regulator
MTARAISDKTSSTKKARKARTGERKIAYSVAHPVRLDALSILFEQTASPNEMSQALKQPLGTVSHHVSELHADGVVELVDMAQRRGAVEHYYRAKVRPEVDTEEWKTMPTPARRDVAGLALQAIITDSLASFRHRRMESDDDMYLAWIPMRLSDEGQAEVTELQAEIVERLEDIKARDEARPGDDSDESRPVRIAATMWFERAHAGNRPASNPIDLGKPAK